MTPEGIGYGKNRMKVTRKKSKPLVVKGMKRTRLTRKEIAMSRSKK